MKCYEEKMPDATHLLYIRSAEGWIKRTRNGSDIEWDSTTYPSLIAARNSAWRTYTEAQNGTENT